MPEALYVVLYRSIASRYLPPHERLALVEDARAKNATRGVTGMLLYGSMEALPQVPGLFVQWIEGPREAVKELFETIEDDDRHQEVEVLSEGPPEALGVSGRLFQDWSMGAASMSEMPATLSGFLTAYRSGELGHAA